MNIIIVILTGIGKFLGALLKGIMPYLLKQGRKPRDVKPAGFDEDLQNDINNSIKEQNKDD